MKKLKRKVFKSQLIIIGSFLIIIICSLILFTQIRSEQKEEKINNSLIEEFLEETEEEKEEEVNTENKIEIKNNTDINFEKYIGILEIPKINIKRGFYQINSKNNNVDKNIKILKESDMPDVENGNLIIAGHSGNSYISFFRNLNKLNSGDQAKIYYNGKTYTYSLMNNYEIEKNGLAHIKRNKYKNTLTLITCKHNTNKQLVFIFELDKID